MKIYNPLQMNDWPIKKFLIIISAFQMAFLGLIALDFINLEIPILRQLIPFVFLTFIPGIIILRILRLHKLGNTETILYSVGLSISILMFSGFFINIIYPLFGILKPISFLPLFVTINILVFILLVGCYFRDKEFNGPDVIYIKKFLTPSFFILCLIPFLSLFGTYLMNFYGLNTLQMIYLLIILVIPILTLKWIPKKFYPFVVFIISLSLLFHTSLISEYIWGADINHELYLSKNVLTNSYWVLSLSDNVNAMLSIVILAPFYSIILKMNLIWVFKIIYPTLYAFVPMGLYIVFKKYTSPNISFLASFYFMATSIFYAGMPALARQEIAELFLALLLVVMVDKTINRLNKSIFLIIFGISLIVSHYGVTYIFVLIVVLAALILLIQSSRFFSKTEKWGYSLINLTYTILFLVFALGWFMYVSNSSIFNVVVGISANILNSITDIFNPVTSQGAFLVKGQFPIFQSIERYLYLISQVLIGVGIIRLILGYYKKVDNEFKALSISSFLIAGAGILLPFFASALNTDRIYHITLFFLAPFFVIGFLTIMEILVRYTKKTFSTQTVKKSLYILSIFLMVFFLFNSAFVYQLADQSKVGRFALDNNVDFLKINNMEYSAINWLNLKNDPKFEIYADINKVTFLNGIISGGDVRSWTFNSTTSQFKNSYFFFGTYNINNHILTLFKNGTFPVQDQGYESSSSVIYDSGGSKIMFGPLIKLNITVNNNENFYKPF